MTSVITEAELNSIRDTEALFFPDVGTIFTRGTVDTGRGGYFEVFTAAGTVPMRLTHQAYPKEAEYGAKWLSNPLWDLVCAYETSIPESARILTEGSVWWKVESGLFEHHSYLTATHVVVTKAEVPGSVVYSP